MASQAIREKVGITRPEVGHRLITSWIELELVTNELQAMFALLDDLAPCPSPNPQVGVIRLRYETVRATLLICSTRRVAVQLPRHDNEIPVGGCLVEARISGDRLGIILYLADFLAADDDLRSLYLNHQVLAAVAVEFQRSPEHEVDAAVSTLFVENLIGHEVVTSERLQMRFEQ